MHLFAHFLLSALCPLSFCPFSRTWLLERTVWSPAVCVCVRRKEDPGGCAMSKWVCLPTSFLLVLFPAFSLSSLDSSGHTTAQLTRLSTCFFFRGVVSSLGIWVCFAFFTICCTCWKSELKAWPKKKKESNSSTRFFFITRIRESRQC